MRGNPVASDFEAYASASPLSASHSDVMLHTHSSGAYCTLEQLHKEGPGTGIAHAVEGLALRPGIFIGQNELWKIMCEKQIAHLSRFTLKVLASALFMLLGIVLSASFQGKAWHDHWSRQGKHTHRSNLGQFARLKRFTIRALASALSMLFRRLPSARSHSRPLLTADQ